MKRELIENLSKQNNGILKTSDVEKLGITKPYFYEFLPKSKNFQCFHVIKCIKEKIVKKII